MSIASYHDGRVLVWHENCVAAMRNLPADSVIEREADYLPLIAHGMERVEIPAAASLVP